MRTVRERRTRRRHNGGGEQKQYPGDELAARHSSERFKGGEDAGVSRRLSIAFLPYPDKLSVNIVGIITAVWRGGEAHCR